MLVARRSIKQAAGKRFASYSAPRLLKKYPVGAKVHGFEIKRVLPVPEYSMTAVEFTHSKTGAQHLHVDREDSNNVFSISFKTNPPDSTGVPHILEHTTLCGSEKYPVRDPFFKMLNRSLANFMNAMTGHDYTFFPFATTNKKDFENLTDIYLDATLNPLLKESDFQQEGWRLENEVTDDKTTPLVFKGVVYNEMKGQVSNSSYYYWIKFQESIYPSLNNSGGDPSKITDLHYFDLVDFHSANYHPSNARTYTYGSFPVVNTLKAIDEKFFAFGKRARKNIVKQPVDLQESRSVVLDGPVDPTLPESRQHKSSVTWYLGDPKDLYATFLYKVMSNLLMDGHSAPLYQLLVESGLGDDFSVNSGFESMTSTNMFTVGLQGLTKENALKLKQIVLLTLEELLLQGFEARRIDAILHQLELSKKMESAEFGMNILYALTPQWVNDVDPFDVVKFEDTIARFKLDYAERGPGLFSDLIKTHLLGKPTFQFTMEPSDQFQAKVLLEEEARLQSKTGPLSEEEKEFLFQRGLKLQEVQNEKEDLSCLPTLRVDDIAARGDFVDVSVSDNVYKRVSAKSNGLTYFRAKKDITNVIPQDLLPFVPLFTECLTNLGSLSRDMSELSEDIKMYTGGLSASVSVSSSPYNLSEPVVNFLLSGVALNQNVDKMFALFQELLTSTNFHNQEKLSTLIKTLNSDNLNGIISSGHGFAKSVSSAHFNKKAAYDEVLNGIKQVQFLAQLNKWNDQGVLLDKVVPQLLRLQSLLVNSDNFSIALTCDKDVVDSNELQAVKFIAGFPKLELASQRVDLMPSSVKSCYQSFVEVPSQVQFSSLSLPGVAYTHEDGAALQVLSQLLTFKRLHKEIREKGGAYGGGANYDGLNGIFNFYSYRDPNPLQSLNVFKLSGEYIEANMSDATDSIVAVDETELSSESISTSDLDQAKLTIFQRIDAPKSVREEGMTLFFHGIDDKMKQKRREELLDVSLLDILDVSAKYLVNPETQSTCVIGSSLDIVLDAQNWSHIKLGE